MTFGSALSAFILQPLQLVFELIIFFTKHFVDNVGLSLVVLSLAINIIVLPLYRRADAMQEEERETEEKLSKWVNHIKKNFTGDERTMMLQTYYRQNNYNPAYVLRSAVSLLLEIPFFIAAYRFLSDYSPLSGASFGPISNLANPDGLLKIGDISINLLPIIMTGLNFISAAIFTKNHPLKTKIQLYGMAVFFLFFLYDSPSGLVFYWTLNNLFSLGKNIYYKLKNPQLVLRVASAVLSVPVAFAAVNLIREGLWKRSLIAVAAAVCLWIPLLLMLSKHERKPLISIKLPEHNSKSFFLGGLFMTVLVGLLIPSAVIKSSPQEFVSLTNFLHPLWYLANSFLNAGGVFLLWLGVFYWLASEKAKPYFDIGIWILCGVAAVNYFFFGTNQSLLSSNLVFETDLSFTLGQLAINSLAVLLAAAVLVLVFVKWGKTIPRVLTLSVTVFICMACINGLAIVKSINSLDKTVNSEKASFTLSKTGKNVMVIELDRCTGALIPYVFNEKAELAEKFSGFTYYSNVAGFGVNTITASPALFGGYEYTPDEINKRDSESLVSKHNEALKVMPVLFDSEGYDVTVIDPPYANYQWISDLSMFDDYPDINRYLCETENYFTGDDLNAALTVENRNRNFFLYGIMKALPTLLQPQLYNYGRYCNFRQLPEQIANNCHTASGYTDLFVNRYICARNLTTMTSVSDDERNTFLILENNLTHDPVLLQEPDYTMSEVVDNTEYDQEHSDRFTLGDITLVMDDPLDYAYYQSIMAIMQFLGDWFDYLKAEGVYDNTRIIVVADHGYRGLRMVEELVWEDSPDEQDLCSYFPLLLVKDFDSAEPFNTSDEFMTNADVPTLATEGLIDSPVNPFTGKPINNDKKYSQDHIILAENPWDITTYTRNTFFPDTWYSVHDSIWSTDNWKAVAVDSTSP